MNADAALHDARFGNKKPTRTRFVTEWVSSADYTLSLGWTVTFSLTGSVHFPLARLLIVWMPYTNQDLMWLDLEVLAQIEDIIV